MENRSALYSQEDGMEARDLGLVSQSSKQVEEIEKVLQRSEEGRDNVKSWWKRS